MVGDHMGIPRTVVFLLLFWCAFLVAFLMMEGRACGPAAEWRPSDERCPPETQLRKRWIRNYRRIVKLEDSKERRNHSRKECREVP
jgi:hypothetical protein